MNTAVDDFLAHLQVERRMSAHTLDAYRRDLDALAGWAEGEGILLVEPQRSPLGGDAQEAQMALAPDISASGDTSSFDWLDVERDAQHIPSAVLASFGLRHGRHAARDLVTGPA